MRKAATGWTIKIDERDFRVLEGRLKSPPVLSILSTMVVSHEIAGRSDIAPTTYCRCIPHGYWYTDRLGSSQIHRSRHS